jgi:hypothetical protein
MVSAAVSVAASRFEFTMMRETSGILHFLRYLAFVPGEAVRPRVREFDTAVSTISVARLIVARKS